MNSYTFKGVLKIFCIKEGVFIYGINRLGYFASNFRKSRQP